MRTCRRTIPAGGCIIDQRQPFSQIQPEQDNGSFFGRFTKQITPEIQGFVEFGTARRRRGRRPADRPERCLLHSRRRPHSQTARPPARCGAPRQPVLRHRGAAVVPAALRHRHDRRSIRRATPSVSSPACKGTWQTWDFDTGVVYSAGTPDRHLDQDAQLARQQRPAESDRGQRRRRDRLQPCLRRAARRHGLAHRRERRPELAGDVPGAAGRPERNGYSKLYGADFKVSQRVRAAARAARSASPSAPKCVAKTTSCRSTPASATTRASRSRRTAARATSTPPIPKSSLPVLKNARADRRAALRLLHRRRQRAGRRSSARSGRRSTTWRCAAPTPRRSGRRRRPRTARTRSLPSAARSSTTTRVAPASRLAPGDHRCELPERRADVRAARQPRPRSPRRRRPRPSAWSGTSRRSRA